MVVGNVLLDVQLFCSVVLFFVNLCKGVDKILVSEWKNYFGEIYCGLDL